MKCLIKYPWVKLPRNRIPAGKGLMGAWMRLATRAAFRKGEGRYCGYNNPVEPGMWVGGIVGLKAILGIRRRDAALDALQCLAELGFLSWSLDLLFGQAAEARNVAVEIVCVGGAVSSSRSSHDRIETPTVYLSFYLAS